MARKSASPISLARRRHALTEGVFRIGPLMALPALIRDLDCDPDPIFASAGFNSADFADPDFAISFVSGSKSLVLSLHRSAV